MLPVDVARKQMATRPRETTMSVLIFRLNGVAEDEADEVRELLRSHELDYYETTAGRWGIGVAALWLIDDADRDRARSLIEEYQRHRLISARQQWQRDKLEGQAPSLWQRITRDPLRTLAMIGVSLLVLYLSIWPIIKLGR